MNITHVDGWVVVLTPEAQKIVDEYGPYPHLYPENVRYNWDRLGSVEKVKKVEKAAVIQLLHGNNDYQASVLVYNQGRLHEISVDHLTQIYLDGVKV